MLFPSRMQVDAWKTFPDILHFAQLHLLVFFPDFLDVLRLPLFLWSICTGVMQRTATWFYQQE